MAWMRGELIAAARELAQRPRSWQRRHNLLHIAALGGTGGRG